MITPLPQHDNLNIEAFSRLFKKTTKSYKYILFRALLILMKDGGFKERRFSFDELEQKMLDIAKYPIEVCRISFGDRDMIAKCISDPGSKNSITRYAIYRLLTPFFENELKGLLDTQKNKKIEELSNRVPQASRVEYQHKIYFPKHEEDENIPIYAIHKNYIDVNSEWMHYFATHIAVIEGWSFWHWANYLQAKNPNVPSLINKLEQPQLRQSLASQRQYWSIVLGRTPVHCIFSGKEIAVDNFALDHFLPWSFVGHDQLWNLIPVDQSINSSKSDKIPNIEKYLERLVTVQKTGLEISHQHSSKQQWQKWSEDYVNGLSVDLENLRLDVLREKYDETISPLATIARNMGFSPNWVYR